ncbi:MAG: hypothetical protein QCI00_09020 [Candidatus Thermoplasmatota archaeon]|nr:hypothetical protein [Candidatus Thermoplasmatota archaeon]
MPGFIPHFIAGNAMFFLGSYYIQHHTQLEYTKKNMLLLYIICIGCSIIPDFPLALYYGLHVGSFEALVKPHAFFHFIISPLAVLFFIILDLFHPVKKRPLWIIGILCIILHIIMDALIEETGIWI